MDRLPAESTSGERRRGVAALNSRLTDPKLQDEIVPPIAVDVFETRLVSVLRRAVRAESNAGGIYARRVEVLGRQDRHTNRAMTLEVNATLCSIWLDIDDNRNCQVSDHDVSEKVGAGDTDRGKESVCDRPPSCQEPDEEGEPDGVPMLKAEVTSVIIAVQRMCELVHGRDAIVGECSCPVVGASHA